MQNQIQETFIISKNLNLSFSKMPGGSFSTHTSPYDLRQTQILNIKFIEPKKIKVEIKNIEGNIKSGYIRAKNDNGAQELKIITRCKKDFIDKSYSDLIYFPFIKK